MHPGKRRPALSWLALLALVASLLPPAALPPVVVAASQVAAARGLTPPHLSLSANGTDDHGNTTGTATTITLSPSGAGEAGGVIETGGDVDFFSFVSPITGRLYAETALGSLPDSILTLYNAAGGFLQENDDCMGLGSCLVFDAVATTTYFIRVKAFTSSQTGGYTLRLMAHPSCLAETPHPYAINTNQTLTVENPGAGSTRVHFFRLGTEATFDFVRVRDGAGNLVQTIHGASAAGRWSAPVPGSRVRLEFTSDHLVQDYGYCVDAVATGDGPHTGAGMVFNPNPVQTHGGPFLDNADADSVGLTNARVPVTLQALDGSGHLSGPFVDVTGNGVDLGREPSGLAYQLDGDFSFTRSNKRFEEVMVYHHVDATQRYLQSLGFSILNRATPAHAHYDDDCNAFYDPFNAGIHFGDCDPAQSGTTGADFAEDADVIVHEYGHALLDSVVPGIFTSEGNALHEAFADYIAATMFSDPCLAEWVVAGCIRRLDNTRRYPEDLSGEPHHDGMIWGGALWDIRTALGRPIADRLVLEGLFYIDARVQFDDAALGILEADQALYGGSHQGALRGIFEARGILAVRGIGGGPAAVDPTSLNVTLGQGATDTRTLTLTNSGASDLTFQVSDAIVPPGGTNVLPSGAGFKAPAWGVPARPARTHGEEGDGQVRSAGFSPPGGPCSAGALACDPQPCSAGALACDPQPGAAVPHVFGNEDGQHLGPANERRLTAAPVTPLLTDAPGDQTANSDPAVVDLVSVAAGQNSTDVTFRLTFSPATNMAAVRGYVMLDTDQDVSTGVSPAALNGGSTDQTGGFDFYIDLSLPGSVQVYNTLNVLQTTASRTTSGQTQEFTVPLSALGNDDGQMDVTLAVGNSAGPTDRAPESGHATLYGNAPWLSEAPTAGVLGAGLDQPITVTFDATGLAVGTYQANIFIAHESTGGSGAITVPVTLTVTGPTAITLDPASGFVNTSVHLTGSGFVPNENVALHLDGTGAGAICDPGGTLLKTVPASSSGMVDTTFTVPSCLALGNHRVLAVAATTGEASFRVTAPARVITLRPGQTSVQTLTVHVPVILPATDVTGLHVEASAGFAAWISSLFPESYTGARGVNRNFDVTLRAPDRTAPGDYSFDLIAKDSAGTEYARLPVLVHFGADPGSITIVKDVQGGTNPLDFQFTGDLGTFLLDDDGDTVDNPSVLLLPDRRTFNNLPPGTYTVNETVPEGWSVASISCNGAQAPSPAGGSVTIEVSENQQVTCTFVNAPPPAAVTFRLTPTTASTGLNGTVPVSIVMETAAGQLVDGAEVVLSFDASLLEVTDGNSEADGVQVRLGGCALSALVANSVTVNGNAGRIHLARGVFVPDPTGTPAPAINGPCTLGIIDFHAKGVANTGGTPVTFVNPPVLPATGAAYQGARLQTATVDGLVRVVPRTLAFKKQPPRASQGFAFGTQPEVEVRENGAPVTANGVLVTLQIEANTGNPAAGLSGCSDDSGVDPGFQETVVGSVATFAGCLIDLRNIPAAPGHSPFRLRAIANSSEIDSAVSDEFHVGWPGNADEVCGVDIVDFSKLLRSFGRRAVPVDPLFDPATDFDGSDNTDILDFSILLAMFGTNCPLVVLGADTGAPNTVISVTGSGFKAGQPVEITFDGAVRTTVTATAAGALPAGTTFTVPTGAVSGPHIVKVAQGRVAAGVLFTVPQ